MEYQRDIFIDKIFKLAKADKNLFFISADFGAPALDQFLEELPEQFIHAGISEQNMIDVAAGMALSKKKVYVYAMAPFITLRCLEQIKCSLSMMNLPVTVIAVGSGLSYADAGPTHYVTEDLACVRSIVDAEVITPLDITTVEQLATLTYETPKFRIIRLEREKVPKIYNHKIDFDAGFNVINSGVEKAVVSSGYALQRFISSFPYEKKNIGVIDFFKIKPFNHLKLKSSLSKYKNLITLEEQTMHGGFGSAVLEVVSDLELQIKVKRHGLEEMYFFENIGRAELLNNHGLSIDKIADSI